MASKDKSARRKSTQQEDVSESYSEYTEPNHSFAAGNIAEPFLHLDKDLDSQDFLATHVQGSTHTSGPVFASSEEFVGPISQLPILYFDAELAPPNTSENTALSLARNPRFLEPWKEYLLEHCKPPHHLTQIPVSPVSTVSRKIAPEMAIIDDSTNGWRHVILPVAHVDTLVMDAVLSASAFHITATHGPNICSASRFYTQAISRLQQRQDLTLSDRESRNSTFLALLVLLVTVMVNGYSDFPLIFKLLESALLAIGGEAQLGSQGELGVFLRRQIRK